MLKKPTAPPAETASPAAPPPVKSVPARGGAFTVDGDPADVPTRDRIEKERASVPPPA